MVIHSDMEEEDRKALDELRTRMKDDMNPELYDDEYLFLRFLKARKFNVDETENMLRKHIQWREKHDIKNIMEFKKTEVMVKYVSHTIIGYDKDGCVVRYSAAGDMDFIGLLASVTPEDKVKALIQEMEMETSELKEQTKKLGRNIDQCVYIFDMKNLTFATSTNKNVLNNLMFLLRTYLSNYPGRLKAAFCINVSMYFTMAYNALKFLFPANVLEKIHIYSDDSYKSDLLKLIDADVLPAFLGGSRTDPDGNPLCRTFINEVEPVPQIYYINGNNRSLANAPDVERLSISSGSFHRVKLNLEEPGSFLEWEFETDYKDIGFGLFYSKITNSEEEVTDLIPIKRFDTELYPESGVFRCEHSGTYMLHFDNTHSWFRTKEVYYRTKIVTHEERKAKLGY